MVGSFQPGRLASALTMSMACVCDRPNESTGLLFQFWSIQRVTKRQITDTVFHCTVATSI